MPTESPNTILLAQILDDLDQLINSQSEDSKNSGNEKEITVKIDGNDDVVSLLTGLGVISKKDKDVEKTSEQLEGLIKIVDKLSKITSKKAEAAISAAEAVGKLSDAFSKIKIDKKNIDGLDLAADFILKLTSIKPSNIKSLNAISAMLTPDIAIQISNFIKAFNITKKEADGINQAMSSLYTVLLLLNAIEVNRLSTLIAALSKLDGGTGKKVSSFLSEVSKAGLQEKQANLKLSKANMKMIATNIAIFIGCITALTILAMIDLKATLTGVGLAVLILATIIGGVYMLSKIKKPIIAGLEGLKHIVTMVMVLTGVVMALSILAMIDLGVVIVGITMTFAVLTMVVISTLLLTSSKKKLINGLDGLLTVGKLILMLVATIGIMMILAAIDLGGLLVATGITLGILFSIVGFVALLSAINPLIKTGINAIKGLGESILCIVAAIGIMMILMAIDTEAMMKATGWVLVIVAALVAIVRFVGGSTKDIHAGTKNMKGLGKFLLMVVIAVGLMTLVVKLGGNAVWQGVGIVLAVTLAMVLMIKWIANTEDKDLKQANTTMMVITAVILVISLIALTIFIPISELIGPVLIGAGVVLGIVAVMVLLVQWLSRFKKTQLAEGTTALAIMTGIVLVISLVAKFLLIPIGEEWGRAAKGATVVMSIIGLMVAAVWAITAMKKEKLLEGVASLAIMTAIVLVISLISKELLIPIGEEWGRAAIGGTVVMSIVGIMTALVKWISTMDKEKLIQGTIALGIMTAIVAGISYIAYKYFIPIGQQGKDAAIGGGVIIATLGIMTLILAGIGKIYKNPEATIGLAIGGGVLAGVAVLLYAIGTLMPKWIETCALANQHKDDMWKGGLAIGGTLVVIGLVATGISALGWIVAFTAIGGLILAGIAKIANAIAKMMPSWVNVCKLATDNKSTIEQGNKILPDILKDMITWITDFAVVNPIYLSAGVSTANRIKNVLMAVDKALTYYIRMVNKFAQMDQRLIKDFVKFITDEKDGFAGAVIRIVNKLNKVGLWSAAKAVIIAKSLRPIFTTISKFMEVVEKFANMKYVTEWDKDGRPVAYKPITTTMFKDAADTISTSFMIFLTSLGNAMKSWDYKKTWILRLMKNSLGPVMKSVAVFTDAILAAVTTLIPCEWNKDGKPIKFRPFNSAEFAIAAKTISNGFVTFLNTLGPTLLNLPANAVSVINMIKDGIGPVMNAVATYANTVMLFVAGKEVEYTDAKGRTVKKLINIDPNKFAEAATKVGDAFGQFIEVLSNKFEKYAYGGDLIKVEEGHWYTFSNDKYEESKRGNKIADLISGMTGIKDVMSGVEALVNLIAKTCTDLGKIDLASGVTTLTTPVIKFIELLSAKFGSDEELKKVDSLNKGLGKLKTLVISYTNDIDILYKAYHKYKNDANNMTLMLTDFIGYFASDKTTESMALALANTNLILIPALSKIANALRFFSDQSFIDENGRSQSYNLRSASRNAKEICKIINDFVNIIKSYENISLQADLDKVFKLKDMVLLSNLDMDISYSTYINRFSILTDNLKSKYDKDYKPTILDTINVNKSLYDTFVQLDNELINKRQQRKEALIELKDNIGQVANQIKEVSDGLKKAQDNYQSFKQAERELDNARSTQLLYHTEQNPHQFDLVLKLKDNAITTNTKKDDAVKKTNDPMEEIIEKYTALMVQLFAGMFRQLLAQKQNVFVYSDSNQVVFSGKMEKR